MTTVRPAPAAARPAEASSSRIDGRLLAAGILSTVAAAVVYLLLIRTDLGQRFDNAAYAGALQAGPNARAADATALQRITADSFVVVLVGIAAIGVLRGRWRLGLGAAASAALAVVGTDVLKYYVLTRPFLVRSDATLSTNTFPSGHTATAIACAFALVVVSPPRLRGLAAVLAGSYGWITAARVQTAGWHRPSDAIGAALLAFTAITIVTAGVARARPAPRVPGTRHLAAYLVLAMVWLGAAAITARDMARLFRVLTSQPDSPSFTAAIQGDAYRIGVNLTVVVVVTLLIALLALIGRRDLDTPVPHLT